MRIPLIAAIIVSLTLISESARPTENDGKTHSAPHAQQSNGAKARTGQHAIGFRYVMFAPDDVVIYADSPTVILEGGQKRAYPRGTLLVRCESIGDMGVVRPDKAEGALVKAGMTEVVAKNVAYLLFKVQAPSTHVGCTRDRISLAMLGIMGSRSGTSAGLPIILKSGSTVTVADCI